MSCDELEILVADFLENRLSPPERPAVDAHLAACPRCRQLARQLRELDAALTAAVKSPGLSSGFTARLRHRIQSETAGLSEADRADPKRRLQAEFEAGSALLRRRWLRSAGCLDLLGWGALAVLTPLAILKFAPAWATLAAQHGLDRFHPDLALSCIAAAVPLLFGLAIAFPRRARELWAGI